MTKQTDRTGNLDPAMAEAVDWIVRLSSGEATDDDAKEFRSWHDDSEANAEAWRTMNSLRPAGRVLAKDGSSTVSRRAFFATGGVAVAAIGLISLQRPPLGLWPSFAELMADHRTGTAQRLAFAPTGGVKVELDARTSISISNAGQGLRLIEGEAFVAVDADTRFDVFTGNSRIEASDASFAVELIVDQMHLACSSGHIRCNSGGQTLTLPAGERLVIATNGQITRSKTDPGDIASWRNGLLIFRAAPLSDVIARINRYRPGSIILADQSKAPVPITAHVFTDQIEDAIPQLVRILNVPTRTLPGNVVLLG